jgi:L-rhamnose-H+ transport protein
MEVITGVLYHAVGASGAALCYTPQKKVVGWSWQTYWLAQAFICWLVLPVVVAFLTIPHLIAVLKEAPFSAMQKSFFLGMAYGIGGTAFGIAIRYVGFSLTYAIAVGISCVLGTLLPPLVHGTLGTVMESNGATYLLSGMIMGAIGIALCGIAGRNKEKDIEKAHESKKGFSLAKGLPLCFLAGILSALYGFSLDQGQPVADVAAQYGAGNFQGNVV